MPAPAQRGLLPWRCKERRPTAARWRCGPAAAGRRLAHGRLKAGQNQPAGGLQKQLGRPAGCTKADKLPPPLLPLWPAFGNAASKNPVHKPADVPKNAGSGQYCTDADKCKSGSPEVRKMPDQTA